jgi:hypothetical protein
MKDEAKERHELKEFEQCTLFNSGHAYADGFDRAVCSCGWKSVALRDHKALVALFEVHVKQN